MTYIKLERFIGYGYGRTKNSLFTPEEKKKKININRKRKGAEPYISSDMKCFVFIFSLLTTGFITHWLPLRSAVLFYLELMESFDQLIYYKCFSVGLVEHKHTNSYINRNECTRIVHVLNWSSFHLDSRFAEYNRIAIIRIIAIVCRRIGRVWPSAAQLNEFRLGNQICWRFLIITLLTLAWMIIKFIAKCAIYDFLKFWRNKQFFTFQMFACNTRQIIQRRREKKTLAPIWKHTITNFQY